MEPSTSWLILKAQVMAHQSQIQAIELLNTQVQSEVKRLLTSGVTEDEIATALGTQLDVVTQIGHDKFSPIPERRESTRDLLETLQRSLWFTLDGLVLVEQTSPKSLRCHWSDPTEDAQRYITGLCREASVVVEHAESRYTSAELRAAASRLHSSLGEIRRLGVDLVDCYQTTVGVTAIGRLTTAKPDHSALERVGGPLVVWQLV